MSENDYVMFLPDWDVSPEDLTYPQYLSLAALLERDIRSGVLKAGTRLPSQRLMAFYMNVNFTTVTRAYNLCREKGLIYGETGRGTFVSPLSRYTAPEKPVIELGVVHGFPDKTFWIVEAMREVMAKSYCKDLFSYTDRTGMLHQRDIGVTWLARRGVFTDVGHTTIFAGAQNAITISLLSLFGVGDVLATDDFTYANLIGASRLAHVRLAPVPGDAYGMLPEELDKLCTKRKVKGVFLMPFCANPTTCTMDESRRDEIAAVCKKHQLIVIEDDAAVTPNYRTLFSRLPEQTIYISAVTRYIIPGLRVTIGCYPEAYKSRLMDGLYTTSIKASTLDAEILTHLMQSGGADYILRAKLCDAGLANKVYNRIFPEDTQPANINPFFRVHELKQIGNGPALEECILSRGVRVCHSYRFAVDNTPKRAFLRISVSSVKDFKKLEEGLRIVKDLLDDRGLDG